MKKPDLEFRPRATCPVHGRIDSYQAWKPGRAYGKYKQQYLYRCPSCHSEVFPDYSPAYNAIDWDLPIKRVGDRKIPLKEKTIQRIKVGLQRYVEPFLLNHGLDASYRLTSEALQTIVAGGNHLFLVTTSHSHAADGGKVKPGEGPLPTLTTCQDQGFVVSPLIMGNYTPGWSRPVTTPLGAITTVGHHSLLVPPGFQFSYRSNGDGQPVIDGLDNPLKTITTQTQHYLTSYYSGSTQISPMTAPMPTIPTKERHALVRGEINVDDCGFRMLDVHELQAGMAFPSDYVFLGTKKQRVAMIGNAVTPPVMRMIMSRCREILN
jgi:DNA (cytosine-5)-methyltransferase 1